MFDRQFIAPIVASVLMAIGGAVIALQPLLDPGYVHPIALAVTGMFFLACGAVGATACIGFAIAEPRNAEHNRAVARARAEGDRRGWDVCDEDCAWMCRHASDRANSVR